MKYLRSKKDGEMHEISRITGPYGNLLFVITVDDIKNIGYPSVKDFLRDWEDPEENYQMVCPWGKE